MNLFKKTLQVDALCLPEVYFCHRARRLAVRDLLGAVLAEHLVHLVGPLDDDPLDRVLEADVTVPAPGGPRLALLLVNVGCSLGENCYIRARIFYSSVVSYNNAFLMIL